jgi:precorrin-6B methylase 1
MQGNAAQRLVMASASPEDTAGARAQSEIAGTPVRSKGTLVVVGLGIQWAGQTTLAARRAIEKADRVFFAVSDPWAARFVRELNAAAEPLCYPRDGRPRARIYAAMRDTILRSLERGERVCAVFYGSPAVMTRPAHDVVRRARSAGHAARMLPGVSSLDCLFADLGFDPGDGGMQCYEAGQFLEANIVPNAHAHLVLFQIALIGNRLAFSTETARDMNAGIARLRAHLLGVFPPDHDVVIYEASSNPLQTFRAEHVSLSALEGATLKEISTLYVPPLRRA